MKYCKKHLHLAYATCVYCKERNTKWAKLLFCKEHGKGISNRERKCYCEEFETVEMWECPCGASHNYEGEKYPQEPVPQDECINCKTK